MIVGLSYGLGSYAFPHALTLFTEPGTAFCVLTAVYFAIRAARSGARAHLIWSGVWAGTALLFRVSAVLFLPILGLWLLVAAWRAASASASTAARWPRVFAVGAWFTAGAIGPILAMCFFNWWRYGSVTNLGYGLGSATDQSYPIVRGVIGQWFSSGKSIFLFAPIAIIVVCGLYRSVKRLPMEMLLLGAIVIVNTLFFARVQFWSGDWAWGPRYLQIVVPCLAAMAAPLMDSVNWRRALHRRERARVLLRGVARGDVAVHDGVLRRDEVHAAGDALRPDPLGPQLLRVGLAHGALATDRLPPAPASQDRLALLRPRHEPARARRREPRPRDPRGVLALPRARPRQRGGARLHVARARGDRVRRSWLLRTYFRETPA